MCGIRNARTARDAHASNDLRITAGGHLSCDITHEDHTTAE